MPEFFNTIIIQLGLLGTVSLAQNRVEIFADVSGNDSLQKMLTIFTDQLKKIRSIMLPFSRPLLMQTREFISAVQQQPIKKESLQPNGRKVI